MPVLRCNLCLTQYPRCDCGDGVAMHLWIETSEIFTHFCDDQVYLPTIMECEPYHEEVVLSTLIPTQEFVNTKSINHFIQEIMTVGPGTLAAGFETTNSIRVFENKQGLYVVDGHHRIAAMIMCGIPKCKVWYSAGKYFGVEYESVEMEPKEIIPVFGDDPRDYDYWDR